MKFLQTLFKNTPKEHYDVQISGRVQDVWFRSKARKLAKNLDLKGYIKYTGENQLYVEVEGKSNAVQSFLDWCRQGPSLARVDEYEARESELKGFRKFSIL